MGFCFQAEMCPYLYYGIARAFILALRLVGLHSGQAAETWDLMAVHVVSLGSPHLSYI